MRFLQRLAQRLHVADDGVDGGVDTAEVTSVVGRQRQLHCPRDRLVQTRVEDLKALHLQATQAADQAKAAVNQNAMVMQRKLSERQKLLSQLDQAKMAEQMNAAMASLSETVGTDVPTFDEVRTKIEARYAKAQGVSELQGQSVEGRMLEVEQAQMDTAAQARLSEIRAKMGLSTGTAGESSGEVTEGGTST